MSYWSRTLQARLPRRRALAAAGGVSLGAAFLAACGGSDSSNGGSSSAPKSDLLVKAEDTTKNAKKGGTLKTYITTDVGSWDPYLRGAWFGTLGAVVFSRLTIVKPGAGGPSNGDVAGDLAEGWETSPDGLTITFKLKPNAHFHTVAPVNGRGVDAQDVVASWDRWKKISGTRSTVDNSASPDAPVVSVSSTDARTVVMKLAFPAVTLPSLISASVGQAFHIVPKEADAGYNPRNVAIGSGPYQVSEQVPSSRINFRRNGGGYHDDPRPYADAAEYPVITEYATGLAAFKAGQLHRFDVRAEDTLDTKKSVPDLNLYQGLLQMPASATRLFFGYKNTQGGMFRDKRLRQAYSLTFDRDLFAETYFNIPKFTSQGLPVDSAWSSVVEPDEFAGWWLDPKGKDFGPNAKWYKRDVAEAKKLVSAAGFNSGVTYQSTRAGGNYGPEYDRQIDIMEAMAAEAGFKPTANVVNYQNELIPKYQEVRGEFEGIGWMLRPQSSSDPIDKLAEYMFTGSGPSFIGYDQNGKGDHSGDPRIEDLIRKSRTEKDNNKRKSYMQEIQRICAEEMYLIRSPAGASNFNLAWPALRNYEYFRGALNRRSEEMSYYWIDETQKPNKS